MHITLGLATRLCDGNPAVWHDPNVDNCSTVEINRITEQVKDLMVIYAASQDPSNSDRTIIIEPDVFETITEDLASATDKNDTSILTRDLQNTIETVDAVIRLFCECIIHTQVYRAYNVQ